MPKSKYVELQPLKSITEHGISIEELSNRTGCNINTDRMESSAGLDNARVMANRAEFGPNELPSVKRKHPILIYLGYMRNLFSLMLITAGLLSFVVFILRPSSFVSLYVGIVFILVAFFNAFLEFYQEARSQTILEGFRSLMEQSTKVIRNGAQQEIPVRDVVHGDLLVLEAGDMVPADARVIHSSNLKVDLSSLTGESVPVERDSIVSDLSADKAKCLIFRGTAITSGRCQAVTIRIGPASLIGAIMTMSMSEAVERGDMGHEIEVLIRRIVLAAVTTSSIFMSVAFIQGLSTVVAFDAAIGILVAFLPQGLPMTITILLTSAAKRMAKRNVLVKSLQAVETLGSLTVIATDKTGTLTKKKMEVVGGWIGGHVYQDIHEAVDNADIDILNCFAGCTMIQYDFNQPLPEDLSRIAADATELGLFSYALEQKFDFRRYFVTHAKEVEIPFDSSRKWNLTVLSEQGRRTVFIKGAPERLIPLCNLTQQQTQDFEAAYGLFASKGQRVIGFASRTLQSADELEFYKQDPDKIQPTGFTFLGMLSISDPPKEGVSEAIDQLRKAGIKVLMVTGDHPITAQAIAREVGILKLADTAIFETPDQVLGSKSSVIHGDLVDELSAEQWQHVLNAEEIVFARTLPRHKLRIVKYLQMHGEIVGAIGDGVNDAPAIKRANLGISMNKTGSDISKDAATMVILDDRFATIVSGVFEGRLIYQNLKKSIRYTLTHILPEVAAFAAWTLFLVPPPLTPILVLMIDVGSELGPALSYAYEPAEIDLLALPPRKRNRVLSAPSTKWENLIAFLTKPFRLNINGESLIDSELVRWVYWQGGLIETIGCFGSYILTFVAAGVPLSSLWRSTGIYFFDATRAMTLTSGRALSIAGQQTIMRSAQSAYYLSIIIGQLFNLFITKTKFRYPLRRESLRSRTSYIGAACAATVGALVLFVPGLQMAFQSSFPKALALAAPFGTGLFLLVYEFFRRALHKKGYLHKTR